jgi:D-apiose dehydrogenase
MTGPEGRSAQTAPPTRLALVGCGFYAQNHLSAWRDLQPEGVDLVAVCDLDAGRAAAAATTYGVPAFTDVTDMLEAAKPDLVDVVTQMYAHRQVAALLAARGTGMIVQKPLAPSWEDCVAIAEAVAAAGVFAAVHENFRYQPQMRRAKTLIDSGAIGAVTFARISFRIGLDVYSTQPYLLTEPRGILLDVGIHLVDLARFFCGEVVRISAETQRRNRRVAAEDTATVLLRHSSGATSIVDCTYESRRVPDTFPETLLEIEGDCGAILLHPGNRLAVTSRGVMTEETVHLPPLAWGHPRWMASQIAVLETNRDLLRSFRGGHDPETSVADNLKTYALVDAAYAAAARSMAVEPLAWPQPQSTLPEAPSLSQQARRSWSVQAKEKRRERK